MKTLDIGNTEDLRKRVEDLTDRKGKLKTLERKIEQELEKMAYSVTDERLDDDEYWKMANKMISDARKELQENEHVNKPDDALFEVINRYFREVFDSADGMDEEKGVQLYEKFIKFLNKRDDLFNEIYEKDDEAEDRIIEHGDDGTRDFVQSVTVVDRKVVEAILNGEREKVDMHEDSDLKDDQFIGETYYDMNVFDEIIPMRFEDYIGAKRLLENKEDEESDVDELL